MFLWDFKGRRVEFFCEFRVGLWGWCLGMVVGWFKEVRVFVGGRYG